MSDGKVIEDNLYAGFYCSTGGGELEACPILVSIYSLKRYLKLPRTGFSMPGLGLPPPDWCSAPHRFCSLGRTKHAAERSDLISEHDVSSLICSLIKSDPLTRQSPESEAPNKTQHASPIHVEPSFSRLPPWPYRKAIGINKLTLYIGPFTSIHCASMEPNS